jgi:hypothetical protein
MLQSLMFVFPPCLTSQIEQNSRFVGLGGWETEYLCTKELYATLCCPHLLQTENYTGPYDLIYVA